METLKFSYNWNNKLECDFFTTLRLHNPAKYKVGNKLQVQISNKKGTYIKPNVYEIFSVKSFKIEAVTEWVARIDTGYSREQCIKMIKTMYKNSGVNWNTQLLDFVLVGKTKQLLQNTRNLY